MAKSGHLYADIILKGLVVGWPLNLTVSWLKPPPKLRLLFRSACLDKFEGLGPLGELATFRRWAGRGLNSVLKVFYVCARKPPPMFSPFEVRTLETIEDRGTINLEESLNYQIVPGYWVVAYKFYFSFLYLWSYIGFKFSTEVVAVLAGGSITFLGIGVI